VNGVSSVPRAREIQFAHSPSAWCQVNGEPQAPQKVRATPSEDAWLRTHAWPSVNEKSDSATLPYEPNAAPWAFWHILQWQCVTALISDRTSYLIWPQRQLPWKGGG